MLMKSPYSMMERLVVTGAERGKAWFQRCVASDKSQR
jgi:hypothetical protein